MVISPGYKAIAVSAAVNDDNDHIVIEFSNDPSFKVSMMRGADGAVDSFMIERSIAGHKRQRLYSFDGITAEIN